MEEELKPLIIFIGKIIGVLAGLVILFALIDLISSIMQGMSVHNIVLQQLFVLIFIIAVLVILNPWRKRKQ